MVALFKPWCTSNLSEREQWKWNLSRLLYEKGYNRKQIVDLYKVIDIMMALSTELQANFEEKITNYQEDRKVPLLSNIEIRAIEKTHHKNIIQLLQKRFGNLPESLVENINKIDDVAVLESLVVETISVSSPEDFQQLIDSQSSEHS
ncbi:DUF4351 domain-containing protein [Calothrix sp. CCY 0018]|uniref:DUF4351 domain-containing protein n=1 Tax=Calothrix sp. CCY 0018 TaxID=3103864 RepID=UPI0039C6DA8E